MCTLEVARQCQVWNTAYPSNNCGEGTVNIRCQLLPSNILIIVLETRFYKVMCKLKITLFRERILCPLLFSRHITLFLFLWMQYFILPWNFKIQFHFDIDGMGYAVNFFSTLSMCPPTINVGIYFYIFEYEVFKCVSVSLYIYFNRKGDGFIYMIEFFKY